MPASEGSQDRQQLFPRAARPEENIGSPPERLSSRFLPVRFPEGDHRNPARKLAQPGNQSRLFRGLRRPAKKDDRERRAVNLLDPFRRADPALAGNVYRLQKNGQIACFRCGKTDEEDGEPLRLLSRFPNQRVRHSLSGVGRPAPRPQPLPRIAQRCAGAVLLLAGALCLSLAHAFAELPPLSPAEADMIGRRLWQNESGGTLSGLTAWNAGENFASLGIGHFIWYPVGVRGPFEESFPPLLRFLEERGVSLPAWLRQARACPWPDRQSFLNAAESGRMGELRALLAGTIGEQTRFAIERLAGSLPKMLASAPEGERRRIEANFRALEATPGGLFALVDYVNFKGDGTFPTERYRGEGWGLLNVLRAMEPGPALPAFRRAARTVLERRVRNAPPARHEERWLPGWLNRVEGYR